jgi:hypothetical protein
MASIWTDAARRERATRYADTDVRGRGRPPFVNPADVRTYQLRIWLNEDEYALIQRARQVLGGAAAAAARTLLLKAARALLTRETP